MLDIVSVEPSNAKWCKMSSRWQLYGSLLILITSIMPSLYMVNTACFNVLSYMCKFDIHPEEALDVKDIVNTIHLHVEYIIMYDAICVI